MSFVMHKHGINMHVLPSFIQIFYTWLLMQNSLFIHFKLIIVNYWKKVYENHIGSISFCYLCRHNS